MYLQFGQLSREQVTWAFIVYLSFLFPIDKHAHQKHRAEAIQASSIKAQWHYDKPCGFEGIIAHFQRRKLWPHKIFCLLPVCAGQFQHARQCLHNLHWVASLLGLYTCLDAPAFVVLYICLLPPSLRNQFLPFGSPKESLFSLSFWSDLWEQKRN